MARHGPCADRSLMGSSRRPYVEQFSFTPRLREEYEIHQKIKHVRSKDRVPWRGVASALAVLSTQSRELPILELLFRKTGCVVLHEALEDRVQGCDHEIQSDAWTRTSPDCSTCVTPAATAKGLTNVDGPTTIVRCVPAKPLGTHLPAVSFLHRSSDCPVQLSRRTKPSRYGGRTCESSSAILSLA